MSQPFHEVIRDRFHELVANTILGEDLWNRMVLEGLLDSGSSRDFKKKNDKVCQDFYLKLLLSQWTPEKMSKFMKVLQLSGNSKALEIIQEAKKTNKNESYSEDDVDVDPINFDMKNTKVEDGPYSEDPNEEYDMTVGSNKLRGLALIINIESVGEHKRDGSKDNEIKLKETLGRLKFDVTTRPNLSRDDFVTEISRFASDPRHVDSKACVVAVMSHGSKDKILTTDCEDVNINDIISKFNNSECPNLIGKPKIFIFQSCRGKKKDLHDQFDTETIVRPAQKVVSPTWEDMIIIYPSIDGYAAYRAWYISDLCEILDKHASKTSNRVNFRDMLDLLGRKLQAKELIHKDMVYKQTFCYVVIHLYKKIYFDS